MKKQLIALFLLSLSVISYGQTTFNYNKWKASNQPETTNKRDSIHQNLIKPNALYIDGFIQAGPLRGPGFSLGGTLKNINIEGSFIYGLVESYQVERLFGDAHHAYTYTPTYFDVKVGYRFGLLDCLGITPQLGYGVIHVRGKQANENAKTTYENAYANCISAGLKIEYQFLPHFGMFFKPEYQLKVSSSEVYDMITDKSGVFVSPNSSTKEIDRWTKGWRIRIGLQVSL